MAATGTAVRNTYIRRRFAAWMNSFPMIALSNSMLAVLYPARELSHSRAAP